jgi:NAD(P)-dependent dehydrogenase (short-subunit alcohol dehydrogenase family)
MPGELKDRVAIVTGGGGGFGRAIALRFAAEGSAVAVTSRTKSQLDETVALIKSRGGRGFALAGDATNRADVTRIVRETEQEFGPVSIMVSNAGVPGPFGPVGVVDPDEWWAAQAVHVRAPFLFITTVLPGMIERRKGCLITISSPRSKMVSPNLSSYCFGKSAQVRLMELLAAEVAPHGIVAFAVDPGSARTQLADQTMNSPEAQRWVPDMVARLRSMQKDPPSLAEAMFAKCAQRCVELAAGRHDELSGTYIGRNHTTEEWQ